MNVKEKAKILTEAFDKCGIEYDLTEEGHIVVPCPLNVCKGDKIEAQEFNRADLYNLELYAGAVSDEMPIHINFEEKWDDGPNICGIIEDYLIKDDE